MLFKAGKDDDNRDGQKNKADKINCIFGLLPPTITINLYMLI